MENERIASSPTLKGEEASVINEEARLELFSILLLLVLFKGDMALFPSSNRVKENFENSLSIGQERKNHGCLKERSQGNALSEMEETAGVLGDCGC